MNDLLVKKRLYGGFHTLKLGERVKENGNWKEWRRWDENGVYVSQQENGLALSLSATPPPLYSFHLIDFLSTIH